MKVGTKSVLFGAHCFLIHPVIVFIAWWKLYGFPWDPRLWIAFFVHDLGYWGKPNMDGPEGESHVEFGAKIMGIFGPNWAYFSRYHSRYYSRKNGAVPSMLCYADKLAIAIEPSWLYLPRVTWSGEIKEYLENSRHLPSTDDKRRSSMSPKRGWRMARKMYMLLWVYDHKNGQRDIASVRSDIRIQDLKFNSYMAYSRYTRAQLAEMEPGTQDSIIRRGLVDQLIPMISKHVVFRALDSPDGRFFQYEAIFHFTTHSDEHKIGK